MTSEAARSPRLPTVCPFVAFDDERDLRAAVPDRRHRCYAVVDPEPRALAHQERYCLSPGFTTCPIIQDWAAREAARVAPGEESVGAIGAGAAGAAAAASGSAGMFDEAPLRASERPTASSSRPGWIGQRDADEDYDDDDVAAGAAAASAAAIEREWDRPRPRRDYPSLDRRRGTPRLLTGIVVLAIAALALFLAPTILRALLGGGPAGPGGVGASPSATASGSAAASASASAGPTGVPSPTPLVYVVQGGDNLTKIANKFDTTVSAILAANPDIKDANDIKVGQQITIPTLGAPVASPSASP